MGTGHRRRRHHLAMGGLASLLATHATGCGGEVAGGAAAERGQNIYRNVCVVCHNADPNRDGAIGPAIAGSPRELLYAKIVKGEYPPGYVPKRGSAAMPRLEYLEGSIDDLTAFLAQDADADADAGS